MDWREEFSVRVNSLDSQHRRMIDLINQLEHGARLHEDMNVLASVLTELLLYTRTHFKTEEALMQKYKFPGLDLHKKEHQNLVDRVAEFRRRFESGSLTDIHELANFLMGWLESHILGTDKKYVPFVAGKEAQ